MFDVAVDVLQVWMCKIDLFLEENDWIFGFGTTHHSVFFFWVTPFLNFFINSLIPTRNKLIPFPKKSKKNNDLVILGQTQSSNEVPHNHK